jgi:hypothetical protein
MMGTESSLNNHREDMIKIHHISIQYLLGHIVWDSGDFYTECYTT